MVGVPHSSGCALCRERHIKCDEAVPECTQCRRYGRTCPGYRRNFRFLDEGPNLARRHRSNVQRKSRGASKSPIRPTTPTTCQDKTLEPINHPGDGARAATVVRENAITLMGRHSSGTALDESLSPSLVRKSFQAAQPQLFMDFISASFPTLYFHNRFRAGTEPDFLDHMLLNFGKDAYLDSAMSCLSSVYLAHLTQDSVLLRTSRRLYDVSLRRVIRALSKAEHTISDNMVFTTIILSVYEMYAQTSPDAWVVHSDAVKRLMMSRGTAAHESGPGRSCFYAFRGFLIATAIYQGKPCFLDEDDWREFALKRMAEDAHKPGEWAAYAVISDRVFMEIAKCPRYISEARALLADHVNPDANQIGALVQKIQETSARIHELSVELRTCISAHSQREQGIIRRPGTFVGPVPEVFPETGPSLLLHGAENIQETLHQLCDRLNDQMRCREIQESSPESVIETPSDTSMDTPSPPSASPNTFSLPFRIYSEIGRGPSRTSDRHDPRAVTWLDRVASSMGVLGAKVIPADEGPMGYIEGEDAVKVSSPH